MIIFVVAILSSVALIPTSVYATVNNIPVKILFLLALNGHIIQNQDRCALQHQIVKLFTVRVWEKAGHVTR
jgi:hypothetical protein